MKKIVISSNTAWNLKNFRIGLIQQLISNGYEVIAVAPQDKLNNDERLLGCRFIDFEMDNGSINILQNISLLWRYYHLIIKEKPDLCLLYTIKPNIFGSIACTLGGIPYINNITGLGTIYIKGGWMKNLVSLLYKIALRKSSTIFFQNKDDLHYFLEQKTVKANVVKIIPGSGINLIRFKPIIKEIRKSNESIFRFLLIARMLIDKGIIEFVNAARMMKQAGINAEFCLLGYLDVQNPSAISSEQMKEWTDQGFVQYLGAFDDVRENIVLADCVVLPSYREGIPRTLLEAAAMAKPIITTNVVGCKEVVEHGVNGLLCEVRSAQDLALKMRDMLLLSNEQRGMLGRNGRLKMEREFDEKKVIQEYLQAIEQALV